MNSVSVLSGKLIANNLPVYQSTNRQFSSLWKQVEEMDWLVMPLKFLPDYTRYIDMIKERSNTFPYKYTQTVLKNGPAAIFQPQNFWATIPKTVFYLFSRQSYCQVLIHTHAGF